MGRVTIMMIRRLNRFADYLVVDNNAGHLEAVGCFDWFGGLERMAVDRGLLEARDELEGVFVVLLEGRGPSIMLRIMI